ncbi:MAG: S1 RNA-binding domain-containing protein, partial [Anaerolinea sp.]|nr:S1 RNA-binding domain-containing protein [Anaerolinea sp.]
MAMPMIDQDNEQGNSEIAMNDFAAMLEESFNTYAPPQRGEIRKAIILEIAPREIIVDLGAKRDGIVTIQDLDRLDPEVRARLKVGEEVPVYVINPRDQDENLIVSINMGLQQYDWEEAKRLLGSDQAVEVVVKGNNRGGILVQWN